MRKVPVRPALNALHLRLLPIRIAPSRAPVNTAAPAIISGNTDSRVDVSSALGDIIGAPLAGTPQQPPPRQNPAPEPSSTGPVRIGGSVAAANLIQQVRPVYPHLAALAGVSGAVEFSAIIGRDGRIANLRLLRGHPLLVRAAADAVRQWRYRPTLLNGIPVEVATDITVQFNLSNANGR